MMVYMNELKVVLWVASSKKDLMDMPRDVVIDFGYALWEAQLGDFPAIAKPLRGFGGADIVELVLDHKEDAFRAVYASRFDEVIIVLHVFQKKSKHGIETPKRDIELIRSRLKLAEEMYKTWKQKTIFSQI
jgi:phage-related protein